MIDKYQVENIHIIPESQNCIKISSHQCHPEDDALIQLHHLLLDEFFRSQMHIHWVQSHYESTYNDEVDGYAKILAATIPCTSNNYNSCFCNGHTNPFFFSRPNHNLHATCTCIWNPNLFISYNTIKKSIIMKNLICHMNINLVINYINHLDMMIRIKSCYAPITSHSNCNNPICKEEYVYDPLHHSLCKCPKYTKQRQIMTENIQRIL